MTGADILLFPQIDIDPGNLLHLGHNIPELDLRHLLLNINAVEQRTGDLRIILASQGFRAIRLFAGINGHAIITLRGHRKIIPL
jgi:hypothetical protein